MSSGALVGNLTDGESRPSWVMPRTESKSISIVSYSYVSNGFFGYIAHLFPRLRRFALGIASLDIEIRGPVSLSTLA